ncbi:MAG TPA: DUF445 family protein [Acidiferrobacter sp.]|nr:DUF445 family protein [Acidiferrobacter sp.]
MTQTPIRKRSRTASNATKRARLRLAKMLAFGLLVGAGLLYALARFLAPQYPWLRYVAAFSQAAMVGALADWFAVVALFRYPLGIKLPHTAIIPNNKDRIADNLGEFIQTRFLSADKVLEGIRALTPGRRLAKWLARPKNTQRLLRYARLGAAQLVGTLDHERVRAFVKETLTTQLAALDASTLASQILSLLGRNRRHQWLLDEALTQLNQFLQHDDVRDALVRAIAEHMEFVPSTLHLDERLGRAILQRLYEAFQTILQAVRDDYEHVLRRRFDEVLADMSDRLMNDPVLRARVQLMQVEIIHNPETEKVMERLWGELHRWMGQQLREPNGLLSARLDALIHELVRSFTARPYFQDWIDSQCFRYAPSLITRYRRTVGLFVAAQVKAWNDEFMVSEIELNIGRDLQFIRINGALVGGLVGLIIYAVTQVLR